jgi:hypothetical protein
VFGYPWYRDCPGVLKVASVEECRGAFIRVLSGEKTTKEKLLAFFKTFEDMSVRTHRVQPPNPAYHLGVAEGFENMSKVLRAQLKTL